jgi:hypothetical protein
MDASVINRLLTYPENFGEKSAKFARSKVRFFSNAKGPHGQTKNAPITASPRIFDGLCVHMLVVRGRRCSLRPITFLPSWTGYRRSVRNCFCALGFLKGSNRPLRDGNSR